MAALDSLREALPSLPHLSSKAPPAPGHLPLQGPGWPQGLRATLPPTPPCAVLTITRGHLLTPSAGYGAGPPRGSQTPVWGQWGSGQLTRELRRGRTVGTHVLRKRVVMPWTSCTTSPCRTGRGGLLTTSGCLRTRRAGRSVGGPPLSLRPTHAPRGPSRVVAGAVEQPDTADRLTGLQQAANPAAAPAAP